MNSYRAIFKTTVLFSALRFVSIVVKVVLSKFVALYLGVAGVGFYGVLMNSLTLISTVADLGISRSSIRNVAEARGSGSVIRISNTIRTVKRLLLYTGLGGGAITVLLSYYISLWTFNSEEYWLLFAVIGIAVFFTVINTGRAAILQGMRAFKLIILNSALSSILGFLISIPFIYYFRFNGIAYSLLATAFVGYFISHYFIKKIVVNEDDSIENLTSDQSNFKKSSVDIIKLGLSMMAVSALVALSGYLMRIYITSRGGISETGYFQAGFQIISGYFGLIFSSMVTDYFPRISEVNKDNMKIGMEVNQQSILSLVLIGPLIVILPFVMPELIKLLYSDQFEKTISYVNIALFGIIFQAGSQTMGMILLAKNNRRVFLSYVTVFQLLFLVTNILGYNFYGVFGLGIAFSINMLIDFLVIQILNKRLYNIQFSKQFFKIFFLTLLFGTVAYSSSFLKLGYQIPIAVVLFFTSFFYSIRKLKGLLGIVSFVGLIKSKFKKKIVE